MFLLLDCDVVTYLLDLYRRKCVLSCMKGKTAWIIGSSSGIGEYLAYELVEDRIIPLVISNYQFFEQTGTLMLFTCLGTIKLPGQIDLHPQIDQTSVNFLPTSGLENEIEDKIHNLALQQGIKIPIYNFDY